MKYQSEHGFVHPVLSPESDHYPDGQFVTKLSRPTVANNKLQIVLDFQLEEPSLERLVREGKARCTAMLYCPATMHQQTFLSTNGSTHIDANIPRICSGTG